ncbi:fibronectin type III domain-containing protein [Niabella sp. CC-SYL272]|uniref:fibronectin type III domain-containing protein n=1 Tax=Niabella agricola TaxID=2891571 RepID=UPI001F318377|nr:fibronectin type III domain-containing protein [Niabella agricola]MCF3107885.1 fibronectin type III domain-containing protein [Niabella agricola]
MKNRHIIGITVLAGMLMASASCEEIFDDDYSSYSVKLAAPADSMLLADTLVQLSWTPLQQPADYQVQVAQPKFDSLAKLVKDTITSGSSIRITALERGKKYQWRVRAIGKNTVSPYSKPWMFFIQNNQGLEE